jgi:type II secretory pathway component PulF
VELPDATDMVRAFYRIFSLPVVAVIVGVLTVLYFLPKPMFFLRWLYAVPVIGPLRRYATLTRIFGQLGILLKMEVPLPEALRLVAGSLRCPAMRRSLEESARLAEHGHPVSEVLSMRWPFGATPHPFLKSAETFDDYPRAMEETHELMDQQAEHYYALWEAVLPPVALVMIAVLVVGTLFTLFLPMIKLMTELSG